MITCLASDLNRAVLSVKKYHSHTSGMENKARKDLMKFLLDNPIAAPKLIL